MTEEANPTAENQTSEQPAETPEKAAEPVIPKHRFDEVNKAKKEAEKELNKLRTDQQQREEERAQSQGEYQELAEKRQKKIDGLQKEMTDLREQMVRDRRYRAWVGGASSSIKSGAIGDAFDMITEDEWATVNEEDENSIRMLAQNLAERKEYLAASPVGAGSGGSKNPVMGLAANKTGSGAKTNTQGSRPTMHFKKSRPLWK